MESEHDPDDRRSSNDATPADGAEQDVPLRLTQCLDGELTAVEFAALEEILRRDPAARDDYVETSLTSATLFERFEDGDQASRELPAASASPRTRLSLVIAGLAFATAALLACVWLAVGAGTPTTPATGAPEDAIAHVVRKIDCVWREEAWSVDSPTALRPGQTLRLERGFMELRLLNDIVIVLDSPSEFTLSSLDRGVLDFGEVAVRVPEGSEGYVIDTPTARLTDLGTEFAVGVASDGATNLRVVEGEVAVSERDASGVDPANEMLIRKDATWNSLGNADLVGASATFEFLDTGLLTNPAFEWARRLPIEDGLALWLAADMAVRTDDDGRVLTWGDVSSNKDAYRESAWQVDPQRRPAWVPAAIDGLPALRFDGRDDCLITEPLATGDNQTVFVVARQQRDRVVGKMPRSQLINYNGPPHLLMEHRWPERVLTARSFAGYENTPYRSGVVHGPKVDAGDLFAMGYVYDYSENRAELYVNGKSYGVADASLSIAGETAKVIGLHRRLEEGGFGGDIAEIAIYNRALSGGEITQTFASFEGRYGTTPRLAD